jgi:hypothetical protein
MIVFHPHPSSPTCTVQTASSQLCLSSLYSMKQRAAAALADSTFNDNSYYKNFVSFVSDIKGEDVFCCSKFKRETQAHTGNRRLRHLVLANRAEYQKATWRKDKTRITSGIIEAVHSFGGRFLRLNEQTGQWYEVDDTYAHDKVSHALRTAKDPERPRAERTRLAKATEPTETEERYFQAVFEEQQRIFRESIERRDKRSIFFSHS